MIEKKIRIPPIFVIAGFTTTILFGVMWIIAAALNGEWIFGCNALSDLGACTTPESRILFNYGCVLTAVAGGIFGFGVATVERGALFASGILTIIGVFFLMGVGAIPETYGEPHMFCAATFGGFSVLAMATAAIGDYRAGRKVYSFIALCLLIATGMFALVFRDEFGFFEALSIICILAWVSVEAYKYYKLIGMVEYENLLKIMLEKEGKPKEE